MKAAGLMVTARDSGRTLFLYDVRRKQWETGGGRLERREGALRAAFREFVEETGYHGERITVFGDTAVDIGSFRLFQAEVPREFRPRLSAEHSRYTWRTLERAPEPLHPGLREIVGR